ncbi:ATP-binding cassette domain-containing protein [Belliella sp. DSM 111904]|uniref:ATP-binding cassette domain-containing protein n=1 Tax=Belliella filtrata TaxID=2923435 RepID=A0ABS9UV70_9BACT|nr:ATP-binding cassette domain-containing protein [Belliella filtrata]MCH7408067.1 ATP-binding cassette domain-containing protein [Belliella filtrata]
MDCNQLEISGIIKKFNHKTLISDIYLLCKTGEALGILGRNGSGKSTLFQIVFGTLPAEDKMIRINNTVYHEPYKKGDLIGYLPQHNFLPTRIAIKRIIDIFITSKIQRQRVLEDERISKHLNKKVSSLSGGELRYLEVLLICHLPVKFILLDEPFSGIEPLYKELIKELIAIHKKDKGFLITDHDYMNIIDISDQLYLMNNGACLQINNYKIELEYHNYLPKGTFSDIKEIAKHEPFEIDQQTLKDLDFFDSYQEGEMFAFFNKVSTSGGKIKLTEIIKSPSKNIDEIESRRDAIKYLMDAQINFNFDKKQLNAVEYYLRSSIPLYKKGFEASLIQYLKNYFAPSGNYYTVETGVHHIFQFLTFLHSVVEKLKGEALPPYLSKISFRVSEILSKRELNEIIQTNEKIFPIGKFDQYLRKSKDLRELLEIIYLLDVLLTVGQVAKKQNLSFPEYALSEYVMVDIKGLFHPLVQGAVTNDFCLNKENNLCFLTGANMSGKSTFLKSFGSAMYLAHLGFPVPAKSMKTSIFNGMMTTINLSDNLMHGYSHYYNEVMRIKTMASSIKEHKHMIVIMDELFKGTNVEDASEATSRLAEALSNIPSSLFIISSHNVEVANRINHITNISFNHFEYKEIDNHPSYTFKLVKGVSNDRAGLRILENEGVFEMLKFKRKD